MEASRALRTPSEIQAEIARLNHAAAVFEAEFPDRQRWRSLIAGEFMLRASVRPSHDDGVAAVPVEFRWSLAVPGVPVALAEAFWRMAAEHPEGRLREHAWLWEAEMLAEDGYERTDGPDGPRWITPRYVSWSNLFPLPSASDPDSA